MRKPVYCGWAVTHIISQGSLTVKGLNSLLKSFPYECKTGFIGLNESDIDYYTLV